MTDIFSDSKLCVRRAQKHILDLEQEINIFLNTRPYATVTEPDADGINQIHKVKLTESLPDEFAVITSDAVNNLRTALDQAWHAIAVTSGAIKVTGEAYFPIANSFREFEVMLKGMLRKKWTKDLHQDILALLRGFQPYKGGNDLIWALNRICATNKHRMLSPIGMMSGGMYIGSFYSVSGPVRLMAPRWDIRKQEIIFAITEPGAIVEYDNPQFSFYIAFYEVDVVGGYPVLGVLGNLFSMVNRILGALEAEMRRLGFI
jgi:hypothetical protein